MGGRFFQAVVRKSLLILTAWKDRPTPIGLERPSYIHLNLLDRHFDAQITAILIALANRFDLFGNERVHLLGCPPDEVQRIHGGSEIDAGKPLIAA